MRLLFTTALLSATASLMASGFTLPQGDLYAKLEYRTGSGDASYDVNGSEIDNLGGDGFAQELTTSNISLFLAYGVTKRLSVSANVQLVDAELDFLFSDSRSSDGISDIWLDVQYRLAKIAGWSIVANAGVKLPQEDNRAASPQITNGEGEWELALGAGHGWTLGYLEVEVGQVFKEGFVNNVQVGGIAYEDLTYLFIKGGLRPAEAWLLEASYRAERTDADLDNQSLIPGIFANSDQDRLNLSAERMLTKRMGLGVFGDLITAGKNIIIDDRFGVYLSYRR